MVLITFPDGSKEEFEDGISCLQIAEKISPRLAKEAVAAKINDNIVDLSFKINSDSNIQILTGKDAEGLDTIRHSCTHLMAQAILRLYPSTKLTIGPVVENGFYYDVDSEKNFTPEDLIVISKEMENIVKEDLEITREEISKREALKLFATNKYKIEMIKEMPDTENISIYKQGEFYDLCRGPHVPRTGLLKAWKLTKVAGAYWRANSNNKQLQRIYGVAFNTKKELDDYLKMMEEAEKRNHKKIGEEMELFAMFDLIGKGLPVWLPKGEIIRQEIENFAIEVERKAGFVRVATPNLAKKELFEKSGHLPYYEDSMYPAMKMDDGTYYLKAMNCPLHHLVYGKKQRSYKELPIRIAEYGTCYRNELSGTLTGLLRVRILRMNDAHIYCTKEQIEQEIESVLKMIKYYYDIFGLNNYSFRLSKHSKENKEKYIDEPENWEYSEEILRKVLTRLELPFIEAENEAAFYGPKIDIQLKNVYGREETMSTVQLDFAAKSRFNLHYQDKDNKINNEVFVIHRAPLSTHERLMAHLIEHFAGKFPLWLSPVQIVLLPIADRHVDYCNALKNEWVSKNLRIEVDDRTESTPKKIRDAQMQKIPLMITIGDKEIDNNTLAIRNLDGKVKFGVSKDEFLNKVLENIRNKQIYFDM